MRSQAGGPPSQDGLGLLHHRHQHPGYFCDPHASWQRGSNENVNGVLGQCLPKGTDLARWNAEEIEAVATALNNRPRKTPSGGRLRGRSARFLRDLRRRES